jgi:hypothetical protein
MMPDLPGYGGGVHCADCMSANHATNQCPYDERNLMRTRDDYTGLTRDLYDDLSAILRNYGYDDEKTHQLMEVLDDE